MLKLAVSNWVVFNRSLEENPFHVVHQLRSLRTRLVESQEWNEASKSTFATISYDVRIDKMGLWKQEAFDLASKL